MLECGAGAGSGGQLERRLWRPELECPRWPLQLGSLVCASLSDLTLRTDAEMRSIIAAVAAAAAAVVVVAVVAVENAEAVADWGRRSRIVAAVVAAAGPFVSRGSGAGFEKQ